MKEKVLTLIIGILIGAILATGGFLIYNKVNENNSSTDMSNVPQMPGNGQKPDGEPPAKPGEESNTNKTQDNDSQS